MARFSGALIQTNLGRADVDRNCGWWSPGPRSAAGICPVRFRGAIIAVRNREDSSLVILAILAFAFVVLDHFRGTVGWPWQTVLITLCWFLFTGSAGLQVVQSQFW